MANFCAVGALVTGTADAGGGVGPGHLDGLLSGSSVGVNSYVSLKSVSAILSGAFPNAILSSVTTSLGADGSLVANGETARITAVDDLLNTVTISSYRGGEVLGQTTYYIVGYSSAAGGALLLNSATSYATALSLSILNGEGLSLIGFAYGGGSLTQVASFTATP